MGSVANVDIDRNNTLEIKAIGVTSSTFATPPVFVLLSIADISILNTNTVDYSCGTREGWAGCCTSLTNSCNSPMCRFETTQ